MHLNEYITMKSIILGNLSSFHMPFKGKSSEKQNVASLKMDFITALGRAIRTAKQPTVKATLGNIVFFSAMNCESSCTDWSEPSFRPQNANLTCPLF